MMFKQRDNIIQSRDNLIQLPHVIPCLMLIVVSFATVLQVACVQVDLANVVCSDGSVVSGARKVLKAAGGALDDPERFRRHARLQAKEAMIMLQMQDADVHPSGHGCPYLPRLLAVNLMTAGELPVPSASGKPATDIPHPLETLVTELVMQYAANGNMFHLIARQNVDFENGRMPDPVLPMAQVWHLSSSIAQALLHLHQGGWVHSDVKPENIVLHHNGDPMLVDFGLTQKIGKYVSRPVGTPGYMAPEMLAAHQTKEYFMMTDKIDIYAFGVTLLRMIAPAAMTQHQQTLPEVLLSGWLPCGRQFEHIIRLAIHTNPQQRPSMAAICDMLKHGMEESESVQPYHTHDEWDLTPCARVNHACASALGLIAARPCHPQAAEDGPNIVGRCLHAVNSNPRQHASSLEALRAKLAEESKGAGALQHTTQRDQCPAPKGRARRQPRRSARSRCAT